MTDPIIIARDLFDEKTSVGTQTSGTGDTDFGE
jgi:hypothetical protein